jgi:hypothetical protein
LLAGCKSTPSIQDLAVKAVWEKRTVRESAETFYLKQWNMNLESLDRLALTPVVRSEEIGTGTYIRLYEKAKERFSPHDVTLVEERATKVTVSMNKVAFKEMQTTAVDKKNHFDFPYVVRLRTTASRENRSASELIPCPLVISKGYRLLTDAENKTVDEEAIKDHQLTVLGSIQVNEPSFASVNSKLARLEALVPELLLPIETTDKSHTDDIKQFDEVVNRLVGQLAKAKPVSVTDTWHVILSYSVSEKSWDYWTTMDAPTTREAQETW